MTRMHQYIIIHNYTIEKKKYNEKEIVVNRERFSGCE